nr:PAS domain S-box protein [Ectothiorhodospira haloalkaliphila]
MVELGAETVEWSEEACRIYDHEPVSGATRSLGGRAQDHEPVTRVTLEYALSFYVPGDRDRMEAVFRHCADTGEPFDVETRMCTARDREIWVRAIGVALRDDQGRITHVQGALQDITDRKRAEQSLRQWSTVFQATSEGVMITDPQGEILAVNRSFS